VQFSGGGVGESGGEQAKQVELLRQSGLQIQLRVLRATRASLDAQKRNCQAQTRPRG